MFRGAEEGSRFSVYVQWKRGFSAHVFIAEKVNGKITCVDPQNGKLFVNDYFKSAKEGQYGYFRLDDKPLTNVGSVIAETVEVKTK